MKIKYTKSKTFLRIFFSYIGVLITSLIIYSAFILIETIELNNQRSSRHYALQLENVKSNIDSQISDVYTIIHRINTSNAIRDVYLNIASKTKALETFKLYKALEDLKISQTANLYVEDVIILFYDDDRVYSSNGIFRLTKNFEKTNIISPPVYLGTINQLLHCKNLNILQFDREFMILTNDYSNDHINKNGKIFILMNHNNIMAKVELMLGDSESLCMYLGDYIIYGEASTGVSFRADSSICPGLVYEISVDKQKYSLENKRALSFIIFILVLVCGFLVFLSYVFSKKYYAPIYKISKIMPEHMPLQNDSEFIQIENGINTILSEKNSLDNRMKETTPYVRHAVINKLLTKNIQNEEVELLLVTNDMRLDKKYYVLMQISLNLINANYNISENLLREIRNAGQTIVNHALLFADDNTNIVPYEEDLYNIIFIINSEQNVGLFDLVNEIFLLANRILENSSIVASAGVSDIVEDINALINAKMHAKSAIENIVVGGKGSIYFYENHAHDNNLDYFFPADLHVEMIKAVNADNIKRVEILLDEILYKNQKEYELTPQEVKMLIYELLITTIRSLKQAGVFKNASLDHIEFDKINSLEEAKYFIMQIYQDALHKNKKFIHLSSALEIRIIEYVDSMSFDPDISLANIAEKFSTNSKFISQLFQRRLKINYSDFIHTKRIAWAAELLKNPELSIQDVSKSCGYISMLTFRRNFVKYTHMNPSDYRKTVVK